MCHLPEIERKTDDARVRHRPGKPIIKDIKGLIIGQKRAHELLACAAGKNKEAKAC